MAASKFNSDKREALFLTYRSHLDWKILEQFFWGLPEFHKSVECPCLEEDRPKGSEEGEGMAEVTWENQEENTEEEDIILHIELKKSVIQLNTNMCCMI